MFAVPLASTSPALLDARLASPTNLVSSSPENAPSLRATNTTPRNPATLIPTVSSSSRENQVVFSPVAATQLNAQWNWTKLPAVALNPQILAAGPAPLAVKHLQQSKFPQNSAFVVSTPTCGGCTSSSQSSPSSSSSSSGDCGSPTKRVSASWILLARQESSTFLCMLPTCLRMLKIVTLEVMEVKLELEEVNGLKKICKKKKKKKSSSFLFLFSSEFFCLFFVCFLFFYSCADFCFFLLFHQKHTANKKKFFFFF
jgi:hypothetical protein